MTDGSGRSKKCHALFEWPFRLKYTSSEKATQNISKKLPLTVTIETLSNNISKGKNTHTKIE